MCRAIASLAVDLGDKTSGRQDSSGEITEAHHGVESCRTRQTSLAERRTSHFLIVNAMQWKNEETEQCSTEDIVPEKETRKLKKAKLTRKRKKSNPQTLGTTSLAINRKECVC